MSELQVKKRSGKLEPVKFDKITARIKKVCFGLSDLLQPQVVAMKVIEGLYDGVSTKELDKLASEICATLAIKHPDYTKLGGRIAVTSLHKYTKKRFSDVMRDLYNNVSPDTGEKSPILSDETYDVIKKYRNELDSAIIHDRDMEYDYFGFKTLERAYLLKTHGVIAERPQHMLMRVAVGVNGDDLDAILETYEQLSTGMYTLATPTLFNAGTPLSQMSSCFLLTTQGDSVEGIFDTLKQTALISKYAGGIGLDVSDIRAKGAFIKGTNGITTGLTPMLKVFNDTANYINQGGKRKGSFAIYLPPWHGDILDFLELKKNHGAESERARDLFYALWTDDLFMERVEKNEMYTLFCPNTAKGLSDVYGDEFRELYERYEREGLGLKQVKARDIWAKVTESQIETGMPYMLYKDASNLKSNQQNLGAIRSSNLCGEILQYTSKDEIAVCNLASIALPKFVNVELETIDYKGIAATARQVARTLNKVIDRNFYPVEEARNSNQRHRPIGIGVQGLADVFAMLKVPFEDKYANHINKQIFEAIYYGALQGSIDEAKIHGTYSSYEGSPISQGKLQFDLWEQQPYGNFDWDALRAEIAEHGVRNSLLLAPMPTASTSQILGNNETTEPYTMNMYTRSTLSGEFLIVNKHMVKDLIEIGMWNDDIINEVKASGGSIQHILDIPKNIRDVYKTVWEISQKQIIDLAAERGIYVCQTQSMNLFLPNVNQAKVSGMHMYAWKAGLKTGMYYLRTKSTVQAKQITVATSPKKEYTTDEAIACSIDNPDACDACGA